jgi:hypothetical protein
MNAPELVGGTARAHAATQIHHVGDQDRYGLGCRTRAFDRVQRREVILEPLDHELKDSLRPLEALQTMLAKANEANTLELSSSAARPAVERDRSTCPPWPTSEIRLARCTPTPT